MTYEEAITQAKAGKKIMRQGWCWCWLVYDTSRQTVLNLVIEDEDGKRADFLPVREELIAKDWMVVE